jgi:hypothetical protein
MVVVYLLLGLPCLVSHPVRTSLSSSSPPSTSAIVEWQGSSQVQNLRQGQATLLLCLTNHSISSSELGALQSCHWDQQGR